MNNMIPAGYHLVVDMSSWVTNPDMRELKDNGVEAVILRNYFSTTQPDHLFLDKVERCEKAGMPWAPFGWGDPFQTPAKHAEKWFTNLAGLNYSLYMVDIEQYGKTYLNLPPYPSKDNLNQWAYNLCIEIAKLKTISVYSRTTFITGYIPKMQYWIDDYLVHYASYPYASGTVKTTWEDFYKNWMPKTFAPFFAKDWKAEKKADGWQFSGDKFVLPGTGNSRMDFDFVNDRYLEAILGTTPPPPEGGGLDMEGKVEAMWGVHPELW